MWRLQAVCLLASLLSCQGKRRRSPCPDPRLTATNIAGVPAPAQADLATLLANVDTYLSAVGATRVRRDANFDKVIGYEL